MKRETRQFALDWSAAIFLWLALGFSLGWYYTFTYYGRTGIPMPLPEACAALILYYFSVLNTASEIQAVHWMAVFPLAGALWVYALRIAGRWFGVQLQPPARAARRLALASVPVSLPGPLLAYLAGRHDAVFSWGRMTAVAVRHASARPGDWLTPVYLGLGVAALFLHLYAYHTTFRASGKQAVLHFLVSAVVLTLLACIVGAGAALPLRFCLE